MSARGSRSGRCSRTTPPAEPPSWPRGARSSDRSRRRLPGPGREADTAGPRTPPPAATVGPGASARHCAITGPGYDHRVRGRARNLLRSTRCRQQRRRDGVPAQGGRDRPAGRRPAAAARAGAQTGLADRDLRGHRRGAVPGTGAGERGARPRAAGLHPGAAVRPADRLPAAAPAAARGGLAGGHHRGRRPGDRVGDGGADGRDEVRAALGLGAGAGGLPGRDGGRDASSPRAARPERRGPPCSARPPRSATRSPRRC